MNKLPKPKKEHLSPYDWTKGRELEIYDLDKDLKKRNWFISISQFYVSPLESEIEWSKRVRNEIREKQKEQEKTQGYVQFQSYDYINHPELGPVIARVASKSYNFKQKEGVNIIDGLKVKEFMDLNHPYMKNEQDRKVKLVTEISDRILKGDVPQLKEFEQRKDLDSDIWHCMIQNVGYLHTLPYLGMVSGKEADQALDGLFRYVKDNMYLEKSQGHQK